MMKKKESLSRSKVKSFKEINVLLKNLKKARKKVVTLNGSFDLLHAGHIYSIQEAKKQGDCLILGLNSDLSYAKYKDRRGPLTNQTQRAFVLSAVSDVDYIVFFDESTPVKFIEAIRPDIHCNSVEYGENCVEANVLNRIGAKLHIISELKDNDLKFSSSSLIDKIRERYVGDKIKAVFLDRDGVINTDFGYVYKKKDLEFVDNIINLLINLQNKGYVFFVITNQSGIGRGIYTEKEMQVFNNNMQKELRRYDIEIRSIYYCPHHPSSKISKYCVECDCRKPGSSLFQKAKKEHNVDMDKSWAIGDKLNDCVAAKKVGLKTILLDSKYVTKEDSKSEKIDFFVNNLKEVVEIIK